MLAELADYVIGLDTRPGAHFATAAAARSGAVDADATIAANPIGYKRACGCRPPRVRPS